MLCAPLLHRTGSVTHGMCHPCRYASPRATIPLLLSPRSQGWLGFLASPVSSRGWFSCYFKDWYFLRSLTVKTRFGMKKTSVTFKSLWGHPPLPDGSSSTGSHLSLPSLVPLWEILSGPSLCSLASDARLVPWGGFQLTVIWHQGCAAKGASPIC